MTGDRVVVVDGDLGRARVEPAAGREEVSFHISSAGDRLEVVPSDASRYLANRTLDGRLFDVSLLIEAGYDDANTDTVPLIVSAPAAPASAGTALASAGAAPGRELPAVDGLAAEVDKTRAAEFWSAMTAAGSRSLNGVERVWLDATGHTRLDESTALVNAPAAWDAGLTGEGVTIAVLDSGIDASHPDLAGRVAEVANFTAEEAGDQSGHGTLVASAAAGTGAASGGTYRGLAPGATLLDGKVTNAEGTFRESAVIEGMQWAADQGAQVVNLSLGATVRAETTPHPFEQAVDRLTQQAGLLFVAAAGNAGAADGTVESPASARSAVGVGAVDKDGVIWEQSSPGPRAGATVVKPDLLAPGVEVTGARASEGYIGVPVDNDYVRDSGTSLSAPLVAGAAALLLEAEPDLAPAELKARLMASADPRTGEPAYQQGAGLLDVATAVEQTVTTEPASVDLGVRRWPHSDDDPVERTVTYVNTGTENVALELSVMAFGPDGKAPAEGMFTLADSALEVPGGGTAATTLTADTSLGGPNGHYSGRLTAVSPDGSTTTTPFGIHQEAELYTVTFAFVDRDGEPSDNYSMRLQDHDEERQWWFAGASHGTETAVRIAPGRYHLDARFPTPDGGLALLVQPLLEVTGDTSIEVDARSARAVEVTVPDDTAELQRGLIGYELQLAEDTRRFSSNLVGLDRNHIGQLGPELDAHQFETRIVDSGAPTATTVTHSPGSRAAGCPPACGGTSTGTSSPRCGCTPSAPAPTRPAPARSSPPDRSSARRRPGDFRRWTCPPRWTCTSQPATKRGRSSSNSNRTCARCGRCRPATSRAGGRWTAGTPL
ncbi:S8 family serine peptidase [Solwaraspora sp. WMMD1047]|uniref:S8 family serine peptidase n=1 Tax=Solwaraspora sp. WMMD1047 TaxID=3016102 RepID=UPI002417A1F7|nr:S8 family serine peptidase [Solwaraspora sp. WMMD1047]MDG4832079.1 S8 family serine peptidase [Solwaraspora sp. WMMD1047]